MARAASLTLENIKTYIVRPVIIGVDKLSRHWNVKPTGVLHVGAHLGEEAKAYEESNWVPVVWIDAQPQLCEELRLNLNPRNHEIICAAIWDKAGIEIDFNVSSNSQSSSLLEFGTHASNYPQNTVVDKYSVQTSTLADIKPRFQNLNFLNLDIQGVELQAVKGFSSGISSISWIYTEVNREEVYIGCTKVDDLDRYLESNGFRRIATRWCLGVGWGDALYIRTAVKYTPKQILHQKINFVSWYLPEVLRLPIRILRKVLRARFKGPR